MAKKDVFYRAFPCSVFLWLPTHPCHVYVLANSMWCPDSCPSLTAGIVDRSITTGKGSAGLPLIARFMGPTWGPSGAARTHVGPMMAPWTLLAGSFTSVDQLRVWTWKRKPHSVVFLYFVGCNMHPCHKLNSQTVVEVGRGRRRGGGYYILTTVSRGCGQFSWNQCHAGLTNICLLIICVCGWRYLGWLHLWLIK